MLSSNMLFNNILKHILVILIRLKEEKVNFGTEMLENAVPAPGTTVKNPQSLTSEKTKQLWSRVFLSHHVCMKPHWAAANSASEEKSYAGFGRSPAAGRDSHTSHRPLPRALGIGAAAPGKCHRHVSSGAAPPATWCRFNYSCISSITESSSLKEINSPVFPYY